MKEKLFDYLATQPDYRIVNGNSLLRPDDSLAAKLDNVRWITAPTQQEMTGYSLFSGRGLPSLLCNHDLTNPGHK